MLMNDRTRIILDALESHGATGCGIISLSIETGCRQETLRKFFEKHKTYCIPINGKYKLNRHTEEKGSVIKIIASIEQKKTNARVSSAFTWGLLLGMSLPLIADLLADLYRRLF